MKRLLTALAISGLMTSSATIAGGLPGPGMRVSTATEVVVCDEVEQLREIVQASKVSDVAGTRAFEQLRGTLNEEQRAVCDFTRATGSAEGWAVYLGIFHTKNDTRYQAYGVLIRLPTGKRWYMHVLPLPRIDRSA